MIWTMCLTSSLIPTGRTHTYHRDMVAGPKPQTARVRSAGNWLPGDIPLLAIIPLGNWLTRLFVRTIWTIHANCSTALSAWSGCCAMMRIGCHNEFELRSWTEWRKNLLLGVATLGILATKYWIFLLDVHEANLDTRGPSGRRSSNQLARHSTKSALRKNLPILPNVLLPTSSSKVTTIIKVGCVSHGGANIVS